MRTAFPAPRSARSEGSLHARRLTVAPAVALAVVAVFILAACSTTATPGFSGPANQPFPSAQASPSATSSPVPTASFPLTLTDDEGGTLTLPAAPVLIVSLSPAHTEIAFALGAGDKVVATTDFDDYPPEVKSLPHVATYEGVDVEKVVGLRPDLVLAGGNGFTKPDAVTKLRSLHIAVLVTYAKDVAGVLQDIRLIGQAIGEPAKAADLAASMRAGIDQIAAATATLPHPRTFYELDATKEIYGPAPNSFVAEMVSLAGGEPITTGNPAVFSIPLEKLVAADPQVIVLGDANFGTTPAVVKARPGWGGMTAVKAGAIMPVDDTTITRPGPRLVEGLRVLALAIHPDLVLPGASPSPGSDATASPAVFVGAP
jgi:iron complex transport system substrate-binding protein